MCIYSGSGVAVLVGTWTLQLPSGVCLGKFLVLDFSIAVVMTSVA